VGAQIFEIVTTVNFIRVDAYSEVFSSNAVDALHQSGSGSVGR
jgi:hypothetical protein